MISILSIVAVSLNGHFAISARTVGIYRFHVDSVRDAFVRFHAQQIIELNHD